MSRGTSPNPIHGLSELSARAANLVGFRDTCINVSMETSITGNNITLRRRIKIYRYRKSCRKGKNIQQLSDALQLEENGSERIPQVRSDVRLPSLASKALRTILSRVCPCGSLALSMYIQKQGAALISSDFDVVKAVLLRIERNLSETRRHARSRVLIRIVGRRSLCIYWSIDPLYSSQ